MSERLAIGTVVRAHGVRGVIRVRAGSDAIAHVRRVFVDGRAYAVEHVQPERQEWLVKLDGLGDRDQAEALRGRALEADRAELPPLDDGEVYVADLIGCKVYLADGTLLGEVTATFPGGGHEVLEVSGARSFLLPFVGEMVIAVDTAGRRITCDPPPGLIDLEEAES